METPWMLWLATAGVGAALAALRRPSSSDWAFDALLLFLLASIVCDGLALVTVIDGWQLNPYAITAGFALVAAPRAAVQRSRKAIGPG